VFFDAEEVPESGAVVVSLLILIRSDPDDFFRHQMYAHKLRRYGIQELRIPSQSNPAQVRTEMHLHFISLALLWPSSNIFNTALSHIIDPHSNSS
jgi:hypothetical protein